MKKDFPLDWKFQEEPSRKNLPGRTFQKEPSRTYQFHKIFQFSLREDLLPLMQIMG
jgi:hypothetical protein